jgi:hypothetical protein
MSSDDSGAFRLLMDGRTEAMGVADPNSSITFNGQLHDFQLVELVQAMGIGGSSGALHLTRADGRRGIIYFQDGALTWCREYDSQALTLGSVLQQLNWIAAQVLEEQFSRNVADPFGELMGQQLVERGLISDQQLAEALRLQILWSVREMSLWAEGTYAFINGEAPPQRTASQRVEMDKAALEIVRYQYEWNDLLQWLPDGMHTQLRMGLDPPPNYPLLFTAAVWRVITRVNAFQTPRRIATALRQPEMDMARVLAPLIRDGLLYASIGEHSIGLPAVARYNTTENVDVFGLLSRMEQEWRKRRTLVDQLTALATFINWTIDALAEDWTRKGLTLAPDSLGNLLQRENLASINGYPLRVERNHINVDDLSNALQRMLANARKNSTSADLDSTYQVLTRVLHAVFAAINMRIDNPQDRSFYVAAWTALFEDFDQSIKPL